MAFDAYHKWLGIPPAEQPPNHYRLLGIGLFEGDPDVIEGAADRQMGHVRTFQTGQHSAESQKILNELAAAKLCLLNPTKKAAYDAGLRQRHETLQGAKQAKGHAPAKAIAAAPAVRGNVVGNAGVANVACPAMVVLSDFGLGKLDEASAETVSQHLETCVDCQARVAALPGDSFVGQLRNAGSAGRRDLPVQPLAVVAGKADAALSDGDGLGSSFSVIAPQELANHPDYELIRELGQGGMGTVYLAKNRMMDRLEVLKVIGKSLLDRPDALERFQQEIRSAAKLAHPNIVAAYTVLRPGDLLVFAMEYVNGQDLAKVVNVRGYLPVANAAFYIHQVALGLQHAHEKGMVHRDIKPSNVMLAIEGKKHTVKILDFGLAKASSEKGTETSLTKSGQMLGTPDYVAPEQILNAHKADIRADIYALGCTLYFLLSGNPPFQETNIYETLEAHHKRDPKPLNLLRPDVPVKLAAVVAKMMAKNPANRYQTPGEAAKALLPFVKPLSEADAAETGGRPAQEKQIAIHVGESDGPQGISIERRRPAARTKRGWSSIPLWQRASAIAGAAVAALLGVFLLIRTPRGTIEIELSDPEAKVTVSVDGDHIDIAGLDKPLSLDVGEHEFTVTGGGYETVSRRFKVARGTNSPLTITLGKENVSKPSANAKPEVSLAEEAEPDRRAAEFALSNGGKVSVDPTRQMISAARDLPSTAVRLTDIDLRNRQLPEACLTVFRRTKHLRRITMPNVSAISDSSLQELQRQH